MRLFIIMGKGAEGLLPEDRQHYHDICPCTCWLLCSAL